MYREIVAAVLVMALSFGAGWVTQGWRLDKKIETMKADQAARERDAEVKMREIEQTHAAEANELRNAKDAKINDISTKLQSVLVQLRQRPSVREVPSTTTAKSETPSCTGGELYREHTEFLIREAARADEITAELAQCQAAYESIRK